MTTSHKVFELSGICIKGHVTIDNKYMEPDYRIEMGRQNLEANEFANDIETNRYRERAKGLLPGSLDLDGNEIVIKDQVIVINYTYPFKIPCARIHGTCNHLGWTRAELCATIQAGYHVIYDEELSVIDNDPHSNGLYEILNGYNLDDLSLCNVYKINNEYYLGVDS